MLNLCSVFQDAIDVFSSHSSYLETSALPASVFLMQQDVVNHYRHAVTHYLPLSLDEHFLQNSSIGTPYEKWAKFTNMDFQELSFTVTNLIRYTVRLIKETEYPALRAERRFKELSVRSDAYISPLSDIKSRNSHIGIQIATNESLFITPFSNKRKHYDVVDLKTEINNPTQRLALIDSYGQKHPITQPEYQKLNLTLLRQIIDIKDRHIIQKLKREGLDECNNLEKLTENFSKLCNTHYKESMVTSKYENLFEGLYL